jgi:transposase
MRKPRKNYSPEEKLAILKRHLVEGVPVSDLCDELQLNANVFYGWQKQLFENGTSSFQRPRSPGPDPRDQRIEQLEAKLRQKNEVLAELMQEHVALKKALGEP